MNVTQLPNGNLKITADEKEQKRLKRWTWKATPDTEAKFIRIFLNPLGFFQIKAEDCGALTGAVLIQKNEDVWGDMNYQVRSFIEDLANGESVTWFKG